ncbi:MAG: hypothetical protein A3E61_01695 [Candidatus Colwellbacteria bacterium RIFCSPHIGHO2_12_FULL_43_12]|uniref:Glycosyltransferase subfamily 4-like N-terminal domain-containing protein n=2 Tax=Candidatus Colwelliibacteriota TaxID=1817904 RepID=A0A1G1Z075_9BACT|nr:MAG: hypothetical protein A3D47_02390 [Candidatus Colwellbacteria bacterium RIFCSPHIGHO2_02_FULL_43_15]OGY58883.1 MAG: hypothetical protein A3E61_01695 [Candidatus Colwellbacteria bacterium RIFCSPHIGHO2_12_FULL_43_12]
MENKKLRIAFCTDLYLPQLSGIADSISLLTQNLKKNGHTIRIYAPDRPGAKPEEEVMRLNSWEIPKSQGDLAFVIPVGVTKDMRDFNPDLIHVHTFSTVGLVALYARWELGVPLVGTDHTFPADYMHYFKLDYEPFKNGSRRFAAWFYNHCAQVTAPSKSMIQELKDYGLTAPTNVISNIIPTDIFRPLPGKPSLKKKLGIEGKGVLIFGRVAKEKNLDFALEVFAEAAKKEALTFVVLGHGPYEEELKTKAESMKVKSKFLGALKGEKLVEAVNACDVYLITSTSDTQSMTTLQSMACELPVVGAKAGGLPEYIIDNETGFIVEPTDKNTYVDKILKLVRDEKLSKALGEAGRKKAMEFSPESITAKFEEVYRKALANKK